MSVLCFNIATFQIIYRMSLSRKICVYVIFAHRYAALELGVGVKGCEACSRRVQFNTIYVELCRTSELCNQ